MQIDGDTVLAFLAGIERAMDDAGNGQHRAFKLIANLKAMGIALKAVETPEPVQSTLALGRPETQSDSEVS